MKELPSTLALTRAASESAFEISVAVVESWTVLLFKWTTRVNEAQFYKRKV